MPDVGTCIKALCHLCCTVGDRRPISPARFPNPRSLCAGSVVSTGSQLRGSSGPAAQETTAAARTTSTGGLSSGAAAFLSFTP